MWGSIDLSTCTILGKNLKNVYIIRWGRDKFYGCMERIGHTNGNNLGSM